MWGDQEVLKHFQTFHWCCWKLSSFRKSLSYPALAPGWWASLQISWRTKIKYHTYIQTYTIWKKTHPALAVELAMGVSAYARLVHNVDLQLQFRAWRDAGQDEDIHIWETRTYMSKKHWKHINICKLQFGAQWDAGQDEEMWELRRYTSIREYKRLNEVIWEK